MLVDVRTVPGSRRMPHFSKASLEGSLPGYGIAYRHMPALGGLRRARPDSTNNGWRNVSFRGYADYMQTDEFWQAIAELLAHPTPGPSPASLEGKTCLMCAEAVPWRCHRSLIADALVVSGVDVRHITGLGDPAPHRITPFARVENGRITYPSPDRLPL